MKVKSGLLGVVEVDEELTKLFAKPVVTTEEETEIVESIAEEASDSDESQEESEQEQELDVESEEDMQVDTQETPNPPETPKREMSEAEKTRRQKIQETIAKNLRTLFVGNVTTSVIEKAHTKEFKKLFQEFGKLESIRFRSIAFNAHMPRKEAFLQKKFHDKRDTLNAYVVFEKQEDAEKALALNGTVFLEKHLRVDKTETKQEKQRDSSRCIFVGNLNFDLTDEAIWNVFGDLGIEYVRLVRDRKTNVGKGFGYVQFKEKSSVMLALKLNGTDVEGRKIRVSKATEKLADKGKNERKKVVEGTRASRDSGGLKIKSKGSKVSKSKGAKPGSKPRAPRKPKATKPKAND